MKTSQKYLIVMLLLISWTFNLSGQISVNVKDKLDDRIAQLSSELNAIKDDAIKKGDFVLSQKIGMIFMYLEALRQEFFKDLNKSIDKLDESAQNRLHQIENIVQSGTIGMGDLLQEFDLIIKSSVQDVASRIGILNNDADKQYAIMYIKNQIQTYPIINDKIEFSGTAFNSNAKGVLKLNLNGDEFEANPFPSSHVSNHIIFQLPKESLDSLFKNDSCISVKYNLKVFETKTKRVFLVFKKKYIDTTLNYKNTLLLLPKYPLKYSLNQLYTYSDTVRSSVYNKQCNFGDFTIPPLDIHVNAKVENQSIPFDNDEVFLDSINYKPKNYYITEVPNQSYIRYWFGQLDVEKNLGDGGRKLYLRIVNKSYAVDQLATDSDFRTRSVDIVEHTDGKKVNMSIIAYYAKIIQKDTSSALTIGDDITENRLSFGAHMSAQLSPKFKEFDCEINPFYWNLNKNTYHLTNQNSNIKIGYLNFTVKKVLNRLQLDVNLAE